jgi:hypothetical protein
MIKLIWSIAILTTSWAVSASEMGKIIPIKAITIEHLNRFTCPTAQQITKTKNTTIPLDYTVKGTNGSNDFYGNDSEHGPLIFKGVTIHRKIQCIYDSPEGYLLITGLDKDGRNFEDDGTKCHLPDIKFAADEEFINLHGLPDYASTFTAPNPDDVTITCE